MITTRNNENEIEINLLEVFQVLLRKAHVIIFFSLLLGVLTFAATYFFVTPQYLASTTLYVNNTSSNNESTTITQSDLSASTQLVNTYSAIITSDMVLNQVIAKADVDLEVESLAKKIEINAVNHTEVFKVSVLDSDPKAAARIANAIAEIAPNQLSKIVDGSSVKVVDYGKIPTDIESPSYPKAAAVGIILGFLISVVVIILSEVMDTTIKTGSDLEEWGLPVLGIVPDFEEAEKHSSYGYRYGNQKAGNRS